MFPYSQPGSPPHMAAGSPPPAPYEAVGSPPPFGAYIGNAFDALTSGGAMSPGAGPGPGTYARAMSPGASSPGASGSASLGSGMGRVKGKATRGGAADAARGTRGRGSRGGAGPRAGRGGKKAAGSTAGSPPPGASSPPPSEGGRGIGRGRGRPRGSGRGRGTGARGRGASSSASWANAGQPKRSAEGEEADAELDGGPADKATPTGAETPGANPDGDADADQDGDADEGDELLEEDELTRQENLDKQRKKIMGLLMSAMTEEQYDQHEAYRRARLPRPAVKRLVNHCLAQSVTDNVATVVAGVGKVFVGEIVESARAIMTELREDGPIQPHHLLEAHRRYKAEREQPGRFPVGGSSGAPGNGKKRKLF